MSAVSGLSKKPYIIRAIYEWCADSSLTPYLGVKVDANVRVPMEYVKNGEIVLSISLQATRNLTMGNDLIQFSARFNGVSREISIPIYAVQSIFARENGQGFFFEPESPPENFVAGHSAPAPAKPQSATSSVTPMLQSVPTTTVAEHIVAQPTKSTKPVEPAEPSEPATPIELAGSVDKAKANANTHAEDDNDNNDPNKPKAPPRGNLRIIK
jgi:stringent starvation protein B